MRRLGAGLGLRTLSRFALIGILCGGTAACSSDASRLSAPFSNPFASLAGEPAATGSLGEDGEAAPTAAPAIRTPRIQTQALGAPAATAPAATMSPRPVATRVAANEAGGAVAGMNPDAGRMTPRISPAAPQPKLKFGEGPKGIDPKAAKTADKAADKADPKKAADAKKAGDAKKHDDKQAKAKSDSKKAEAEAKSAKADATKDAAKKVAEAKAAEAAAKSAAKETKPVAKEPVKVASADPNVGIASNESFRWPAKGRVINGYGSSGNEGINIAVPEGTPVKAAEEGTVAYAGSDVKGYGKLVLVRHANGYVSAYAHNGELDVKPGEKVKRGQVIAKSGSTGNVTSPQLHFEIRKGATPVDPIPHLASN